MINVGKKKDIRVLVRGGLGNQLFQYGAAYALSKRLNLPIVADDLFTSAVTNAKNVDQRKSELESFENDLIFKRRKISLKNKFVSKTLGLQRILGDFFPLVFLRSGYYTNEKQDKYNIFREINRGITLNSYCGNPIYFQDFKIEIAEKISQIKQPTEWFLENKKKIDQIKPVGVHVRLGDYKKHKDIYGEPDFNYYKSAIDLIFKLVGHKSLWLFSDEPSEAASIFEGKIKFNELVQPPKSSKPIESLNLLASCSAVICANSSFSWWAGFLATAIEPNKTVVFPRPMFNSDEFIEPFNWLPLSWITLGRNID